ncbi:MAG TPA: hypothetical protein VE263_16830 [Candidatus Angelobacter sp.]|nr:hypothetical protein [Candidatus Angelobacter sp.]
MEIPLAATPPATARAAEVPSRFQPKRLLPYVLVSLLALVPCFWLPRIEAGDLASHTYNAWLASLVEQGKAPGLWIAHQNNNILFDLLLLRFGTVAGFAAAERIAVGLAVLVLLWGAFALVSAAGGRPAWFLLPLLLMLSYGWTFHAGFFNFYLSLGFSFAALAVVWRAQGLGYLWILPFVPLIWLAHPLGFSFFVAAAVYLYALKRFSSRLQLVLAGLALAGMFVVHFYFAARYQVRFWQGPSYALLGTDQVFLGASYRFLPLALGSAVIACVALHFFRGPRPQASIAGFFPPFLQLYLLGFVALALLPDDISLAQYASPVDLICSRFTLAVAIFGCCVLTNLRPRLFFTLLSGVVALVFFGLAYRDAAKTYALEKQADFLVSRVPQDARILTTIYPFRGFRIFVHHVADRACLGRCFNIDNYEPATGQFRLRAGPGNRIAAGWEDANHMMIGDYIVQASDLPLWQIFQCGPTEVDLCLRPLGPGPLRSFPQR